jgi:hypothetical protein
VNFLATKQKKTFATKSTNLDIKGKKLHLRQQKTNKIFNWKKSIFETKLEAEDKTKFKNENLKKQKTFPITAKWERKVKQILLFGWETHTHKTISLNYSTTENAPIVTCKKVSIEGTFTENSLPRRSVELL